MPRRKKAKKKNSVWYQNQSPLREKNCVHVQISHKEDEKVNAESQKIIHC